MVNKQSRAGQSGRSASAVSVNDFCDDHGIGRTTLYALMKEGKGPRTFKVGRRTLISVEAAAEWRRRMEGVDESPEAPVTVVQNFTVGDVADRKLIRDAVSRTSPAHVLLSGDEATLLSCLRETLFAASELDKKHRIRNFDAILARAHGVLLRVLGSPK